MRQRQATHAYIASLRCGCVEGAAVDLGDLRTAAVVNKWIKEGYAVSRVTLEEYQRIAVKPTFMDCPHEGGS